MARVLLIQPPLTKTELFARGSESSASLLPPLGLAYLAAYLKAHGYACRIINGIAQPKPISEIVSISKSYDVAGINVVSAYALRALELVQAMKSADGTPPFVVGGPHVTALPESMVRSGAGLAVIGEGEQTLIEVVEWLGGSKDRQVLRAIRGIGYIEDGKYVFTGTRPKIDPLDRVPLPDRTLLPMPLHRSSIARATAQPSHSLLTSRGCPGVCTFCSKLTFGTHLNSPPLFLHRPDYRGVLPSPGPLRGARCGRMGRQFREQHRGGAGRLRRAAGPLIRTNLVGGGAD